MTYPEQPGNRPEQWPTQPTDPTSPTVPVSGSGQTPPETTVAAPTTPMGHPDQAYAPPGYQAPGAPPSGYPDPGYPGQGFQGQDYQGQGYQGQGYQDPATLQQAYPPPDYPAQGYAGQGYPPPGYAPPGYAVGQGYAGQGYPPYGPGPAQSTGTNGLAITSLVLSLLGLMTCGTTALVGAILGHVAKRQIRERREGGEGLATAGIITGWIVFVLVGLLAIGYVVFVIRLVESNPDLLEPTPAIS